jgi:CRISPR-associated endoribonuclease Cas6
MHAYIKMKTDPSSPAVPIQYNSLVQAAIYSALPEETAARLHDQGYTAGRRSFKLFSFSRLLGRFAIDRGAGTIAFPEGALLVISSPEMEFFLSLIKNLLTKSQFRRGFRRGFRRAKPVTYLCGLV